MPKKQKEESDEEYKDEEQEEDEVDEDETIVDEELGEQPDEGDNLEDEETGEQHEDVTETYDIDDTNNLQIAPEILAKEKRITRNKLTKYEMVRILGERIKQLTMGAKPLIKNIIGLSYDIIAEEELKLNMIPFKIKRPLPNGKVEIWTLDELDKSHLLSYLE